MDYIANIAFTYGKQAARRAKAAFRQLLLPLPKSGEYYQRGDGQPTFLTEFATVIRITDCNLIPLLRSDYLLRPIVSIVISDKARIDIQPAGPICGWISYPAGRARDAEGIIINDSSNSNYVHFPEQEYCPSNKLFEGLNFDPRKVQNLENNVREIKKMLDKSDKFIDLEALPNEKPDFQDLYFKDLRQAFRDAYDPVTDTLVPKKIISFWNRMTEAKKSGMLATPWAASSSSVIDSGARCRGVPPIARAYDRRLKTKSPIFRGYKAA